MIRKKHFLGMITSLSPLLCLCPVQVLLRGLEEGSEKVSSSLPF